MLVCAEANVFVVELGFTVPFNTFKVKWSAVSNCYPYTVSGQAFLRQFTSA